MRKQSDWYKPQRGKMWWVCLIDQSLTWKSAWLITSSHKMKGTSTIKMWPLFEWHLRKAHSVYTLMSVQSNGLSYVHRSSNMSSMAKGEQVSRERERTSQTCWNSKTIAFCHFIGRKLMMFVQWSVTFWGWSSLLVMCIISSKCVCGILVWAERQEKSGQSDLFPLFLSSSPVLLPSRVYV